MFFFYKHECQNYQGVSKCKLTNQSCLDLIVVRKLSQYFYCLAYEKKTICAIELWWVA